MSIKRVIETCLNGVQYCIALVQIEQIARIVGLVLSVIVSCLITAEKLYSWWKKAKQDGKITKDEIEEGVGIIKEGVNDVKEHIEK